MAKQVLPNQPGVKVAAIAEDTRLFDKFNDTSFDYPRDKSLAELFYEQTEKTPGNVALIYEDKEYTYAELNTISNQFADYLGQTYAISPDDLVGIMLDR